MPLLCLRFLVLFVCCFLLFPQPESWFVLQFFHPSLHVNCCVMFSFKITNHLINHISIWHLSRPLVMWIFWVLFTRYCCYSNTNFRSCTCCCCLGKRENKCLVWIFIIDWQSRNVAPRSSFCWFLLFLSFNVWGSREGVVYYLQMAS